MEQPLQTYRKLPGRRRGFLFGSSLWMGPDHLLLVKSARFREDYRRFYFRDIQAIVTAGAPRFHISTRSAFFGVLWLAVLLIASLSARAAGVVKWLVASGGVLLMVAWAYVSAKCSCRCRIYTAVSSEELKSLYRTWTARRFLERVQPYIAHAQGVVEGNWADAVEDKQVGPIAEGRVGLTMPGAAAPLTLPPASPAVWSTPVSTFFVGSLCLGGLADLLAVRANGPLGRWILLLTLLVQLAAAVLVVVQNYNGKLRPAMRNLAIVALALIGLWYYAVQVGAGMAWAYQNARSRNPKVFPAEIQAGAQLEHPLARGSAGGITLLLGLAGAILGLRGKRPVEDKVSFNV